MTQQPVPSNNRPRTLAIRTILCVGILGSVATLVLQSHPLVTGIAVGVFFCCLLTALFRVLRRTSRHIDRIMAEELDASEKPARRQETWRKSA
jgi:hypothetical protein